MTYLIAPSLLSADMTKLGEEALAVMDAGADMIHFDVMDNHYVPNLTFGPPICQALHQRFPNYMIDVHLMACPVDDLIVQFAKAGAKRISIHPDATTHLDRSLQLIQQQGCKAGLVLNPATSIDCLRWSIHRLDFILVMTVNPGFGGQKLIPEVIDKIKLIKLQYPALPICVDGGVSVDNVASLAKSGATEFVAGTAIFSTANYAKTIKAMREKLALI
ncbi:ribulose-phosphate 3-epimerase [Legionella micdadei]|uniref:Ribulose-phosphate 3-epimerase n=1 Tax=Legionella micdadei TaxID=451 RepID=A0A098GHH9_LEGMI|nr:ribulose-phosphate 3-epimerase [Legionella micdadei]ARG97129.1 ribulose-phosphate 3-epimerase [Legionella micdadei]KTD29276.1 D-ribulose-5-phosphate-3-epimerase [Legionella micdadei]NSL17351.1 ribulose-phosphate 3-epimerase [Legionella micdadei]CEG61432.1 Ribulose-phosphate 3-epimerase [Legionella micdadei]SCY40870.1 ribulose-5-phosphate 3-epimerase [Legionella micdadei]